MWLLAVSASLLPAVIMVSSRYHGKVTALCRRAHGWLLSFLQVKVCVRSTHAFVFSNCTHGKVNSVLETFDLYAETHPSLCIGPQIGEMLDEVVRRERPMWVLELGMHCAYSSVRLLRMIPPTGTLIAVELDPITADLGEEVILVAGFKHPQFQVLACSSAEAIANLCSHLKFDEKTCAGFSLVLMDHDPDQYLPDLLALEREELLCPSGCSLVLINRNQTFDRLGQVLNHIEGQTHCYSIRRDLQGMMEIYYRKEGL